MFRNSREDNMKKTLIATSFLFLFMGFPAMACDDGSCVDTPPPQCTNCGIDDNPPPPKDYENPTSPEVVINPGSEPWVVDERIYYSVCTCDELKTAWGFESLEKRTAKARSQCEQRRERIACPQKWK
jgi:hypothetical protein